MGYLLNFIVYTIAMIGIISLAVIVYKKFSFTGTSKSQFLNVEEFINLAPRKQLYVVRAGKERFLIASDVDKTSLISKLDDNSQVSNITQKERSVDDLPTIVDIKTKQKSNKIFKNIVSNI